VRLINKDLERAFRKFNKDYFNDELPPVTIKFDTDKELDVETYGEFTVDGEILINECLREIPEYCFIVVLHEMSHVKHPMNSHGIAHKAVLFDLFMQGAYDPYL
jgi:predicted metal-dependent hydrolase